MNNNDLIRREDVFQELDSFLAEVEEKMCIILEQYGACANRAVTNCEETARGAVNNIRKRINAIPAVQQPMNAVEYARNFARMCASHTCGKCPFHESEKFSAVSCVKFEREYPEEAVAIVQKWAAENKK